MHLLGRMLAFDPGRRISAEEALSHEYFAALESSAVSDLGESLLNPHTFAGPRTLAAKELSTHALCNGASTLDIACSCGEHSPYMLAEEVLLDISLEEGMDHIDMDVLHRDISKRPRTHNLRLWPSVQTWGTPQMLHAPVLSTWPAAPAEESLLDITLEEGMDRMDLDVLHREAGKRARSINPAISDLRLAVDAAAEMQV